MILWFLGLFNAFQDLRESHANEPAGIATRKYQAHMAKRPAKLRVERDSLKMDLTFNRARLQELEAENIRLQDRVEAANEDRAKLWTMLQEALGNERKALMMEVNAKWQKDYGVTPFPDAPSIPEKYENAVNAVTEFGRQGRLLPSEMVANAEKEYWVKKAKRQAEEWREDSRDRAEAAKPFNGVNG